MRITRRAGYLLAVAGGLLAVVVACQLTAVVLTCEMPDVPPLPSLPKPAPMQAGKPGCCKECH